ncbi:hypothetical protein D3C76_733890 [compost metagenome]
MVNDIHLKAEVQELLALAEQADRADVPDGVNLSAEIKRRDDRLSAMTAAKAKIVARAKERFEREQAAYQAKVDRFGLIHALRISHQSMCTPSFFGMRYFFRSYALWGYMLLRLRRFCALGQRKNPAVDFHKSRGQNLTLAIWRPWAMIKTSFD